MEIDFNNLLLNWGITFKKIRKDLKVIGSPDRYIESFVVEDIRDKKYIIEKINFFEQSKKEKIASILWELHKEGLDKISLYLPNIDGKFITEYKLRSFQLREFIDGEILNRNSYFYDDWRGEKAGEFLIKLLMISSKISKIDIVNNKEMSYYIFDLNKKIGDKIEKVEYKNIVSYIENNYVPIENQIPYILCHGDYHPMNIIWGENSIRSVIDWEFLGKREIYIDISNMIGCVGSENPKLIFSGMIKKFLEKVFENEIFYKNREYIFDIIVALRYAGWLSLWLRNNDKYMISREINYINYLIENKTTILNYIRSF